jgi:thiol-disulfide isomerase/thioredoxin
MAAFAGAGFGDTPEAFLNRVAGLIRLGLARCIAPVVARSPRRRHSRTRPFAAIALPPLAFLGALASACAVPGSLLAAEPPGSGFLMTNGTVTVGLDAPAVSGEDLEGRPVPAGRFRGRPVLLDFGSIFCPSCQETLREMKRLEDAYRDTDLALVVVVDGDTPVKALRAFFRGIGAGYTVLRSPGSALFRSYGVDTIPFQVLVGRDGKVRKIHAGFDPGMEEAMGLRETAGGGRVRRTGGIPRGK